MAYEVNEQIYPSMSATAFAVLRDYAHNNPALSLDTLKIRFAREPGRYHDMIHAAGDQVVRDHPERFSRETFSVADEDNVVVTNQWTSEEFADFMDYCATLGDQYRIVEV